MKNLTEKAVKTGDLTDEEIESLSDHELKNLYHTMKRHADFETNQVDFKHAMHLIRLLRMGKEILIEEIVKVKRPDAKELLDIRNGSLSYNEIIGYANEIDNEIKQLYKITKLPKKPDIKFAANLLMKIQDLVWEQKHGNVK